MNGVAGRVAGRVRERRRGPAGHAGGANERAPRMNVEPDLVALRGDEVGHPVDEQLAPRRGDVLGERVRPDEVRDDKIRVALVQALLAPELVVGMIRIVPVVRDGDVERMTAREVERAERGARLVGREQHAVRARCERGDVLGEREFTGGLLHAAHEPTIEVEADRGHRRWRVDRQCELVVARGQVIADEIPGAATGDGVAGRVGLARGARCIEVVGCGLRTGADETPEEEHAGEPHDTPCIKIGATSAGARSAR